jgi:probable rRNA maturation factor
MRRAPAGRKSPHKRPHVDIVVGSPLWKTQRGATAMLRRSIAEAAAAAAGSDGEIAILLTDDSAMCDLNRRWRGEDAPTNVLSFPAVRSNGGHAGSPLPLGDIVIAYETTAREASAQDTPFVHHLAHLAVHGFLHLLGYDHEADADAEAMEHLEAKVLARIGVPNPYRPRHARA